MFSCRTDLSRKRYLHTFLPTCWFQQAPQSSSDSYSDYRLFSPAFQPLFARLPLQASIELNFPSEDYILLKVYSFNSFVIRQKLTVSNCRLRGFTAVRCFLPPLYFVLGLPTLTGFAQSATSPGFIRGFSPFAHTTGVLDSRVPTSGRKLMSEPKRWSTTPEGLAYHGSPRTRIQSCVQELLYSGVSSDWVTSEAPTPRSAQHLFQQARSATVT